MTALVTLRNVTKSYVRGKQKVEVLHGIDLTIETGEFLALMGPSGSGKTTFLRCLNGLERADAGTVRVGAQRLDARDRPAAFQTAARGLCRSLGFVFQGCHLFSHRTVLDNVMEGPVHVRREPISVARERAQGLLEVVGVAHRAAAWPRDLSGGEQQRAAIARALAMKPEVLLLDEPTSALDPARTEALAALLGRLVADGLSVVTVTHDLPFAQALARRRYQLDGGRFDAI